MENKDHEIPSQLQGLDKFSKLLDSSFRIPFINIRFGIDFVIGLIPYAGDLMSFLFSGGLVVTMARHGASGQILARMLWNIALDTVVGSIPILGDLFDLFFKANRRNFHLLEKHYGEGDYEGSAWRIVIPVLIVLVLLFVLMIWLVYTVGMWGWDLIFS